MDRCRPESRFGGRDVLSPGDPETLSRRVLVGSKTVRSVVEEPNGQKEERSKVWSEEPPEVAGSKSGRCVNGPTWACLRCGASDCFFDRADCHKCGAARSPTAQVHKVFG